MNKNISVVILGVLTLAVLGFEPADVVEDSCGQVKAQAAACAAGRGTHPGTARNVILLIGDGMGIGQTYAGRVFLNGPDQPLPWEKIEHRGLVTTCSIGSITDSAASATAMGTGHKTKNGIVDFGPGPDYVNYPNVLDLVHADKAVGVVTTTMVWDATPAGFTAHSHSRNMDREIAHYLLETAKPEVIMGGGAAAFTSPWYAVGETDAIAAAKTEGYAVVRDRGQLAALDLGATRRLLGLFADQKMAYEHERTADSREPHLTDMAKAAIGVLANDPRGFFVMIEGGRIDHACHETNEDALVGEMAEFNRTVEYVLEWAAKRGDTLVIITADHETGGIEVQPGEYHQGDEVKIEWTKKIGPLSATHSSQQVPVYAQGPNADAVAAHQDNTQVFCLIMNAFQKDFNCCAP